jgi:hypothetical protein
MKSAQALHHVLGQVVAFAVGAAWTGADVQNVHNEFFRDFNICPKCYQTDAYSLNTPR